LARVTRRWPAIPVLVLACALCAAPASAKWYGSKLKGKPNADYGCETALINGPLGGPVFADTNQTSCTYRHGGYLFTNRRTFLVPRTGRITKIRVKSGSHPSKLRLTILTGSSRVDPFSGRDQPGTYTCCTARYVSRPFKVKANRTTTKKVNVKVYDVRDKRLQYRIHSTDIVALSGTSRGTMPLRITKNVGSYNTGTPLLIGFWPRTKKGDPRVDGYSMTGIDLMFQWNFKAKKK
jgi:hypothetical protein